jgi:two-component system phosphate regulon sensor histidine kinase PhoR
MTAAPHMAEADRLRFERILMNHAGRLSRLVQDLLDLSRAEAQRPRLEPVSVPLVLHSALAAVRERAEAKTITLEVELPSSPSDALPAVAAEPTAIEQVLVNLLDNAVKYTPAGGRVLVRAGLDDAASEPGNRGATPKLRIEVEDNGIGIPAEHLPRLFERFYRVDPARSRDMGGTGLGLAIVKHLVQSFGGDVSVRSRVGAGTVFVVSLPLIESASAATDPVAEAHAAPLAPAASELP